MKCIYRNGETFLDGDEEDAKECAQHYKEVKLISLENVQGRWDIDEANHSSDNDSSKDKIGSVLEEWHEEEECHHNRHRHDDVRRRRLRSCVVVDRRP